MSEKHAGAGQGSPRGHCSEKRAVSEFLSLSGERRVTGPVELCRRKPTRERGGGQEGPSGCGPASEQELRVDVPPVDVQGPVLTATAAARPCSSELLCLRVP